MAEGGGSKSETVGQAWLQTSVSHRVVWGGLNTPTLWHGALQGRRRRRRQGAETAPEYSGGLAEDMTW
eukprot:3288272-Pyramimonas_sp.AAC.1